MFWFIILFILIFLIAYNGGKEYLYHGSYQEFKKLIPYPSGVINSEKAVFATPDYIDAVIFSAQWSDYNFGFGKINGEKYLLEKYDGALDKLNKIGYIHYVEKKYFKNDERLPISELISYTEVPVIKCEKVNVMEEVFKFKDLKIIKFEKHRKKKGEKILIDIVYVPIDENWQPNIENVKYFRELKDIGNSNKICGDILDPLGNFYNIEYKEAYLVEPKNIIYYGNKNKTSEEEYFKYIEARRQIYSDFPKLILN